jgi:hypothetical protein
MIPASTALKLGAAVVSLGTLFLASCTPNESKKNDKDRPTPPQTPPVTPPAAAAPSEKTLKPGKRIDYTVDYGPLSQNKQIVQTSLMLAEAYRPEGNSVFDWKKPPLDPNKVEYSVIFIESKDKIYQDIMRQDGGRTRPPEAITATIQDPKTGKYLVATLVVADKVFFDAQGREREDALARLSTYLAHEMHANATSILEKIADGVDLTNPANLDRRADELKSWQAGIDFIHRATAAGSIVPAGTKEKLRNLLPEEEAGLRSWQN